MSSLPNATGSTNLPLRGRDCPHFFDSIEVLQEIFLCSHPPCADDSDWESKWHLELVLRKWRQAAIGCTELWSYIPETTLHSVRNRVGLLDAWIKRSLDGPLD